MKKSQQLLALFHRGDWHSFERDLAALKLYLKPFIAPPEQFILTVTRLARTA